MSEPIVYIDTSELRQGRLPEVQAAMNELAAFVDGNEPQLISYEFYVRENGTRMDCPAEAAPLPVVQHRRGGRFSRPADPLSLTGAAQLALLAAVRQRIAALAAT